MSKPRDTEVSPPRRWPSNNPVKWADLLNALSNKDPIPEWPLLSPNIASLNCETCSRQFVSSTNYRRHMLTHNRTSKLDKELARNRDLLQQYWDSLSLDDFKQFVALKDVKLKGVSGRTIIQQLASFIQKPKIVLPGAYFKAGTSLLNVLQTQQTKCRISSKEFFGILNDASEQTFLCSVIEDSVQTNVFEGDDTLTNENLAACICFLLEQKLVKDWNAHTIAESLVKEADKERERQAKNTEKNKKKKLKQKKKKNEKKAQKQVEAAVEGDDEDTRSEDLCTQVAHLGQMSIAPAAAQPLDAEKDGNRGLGQKEEKANEKIEVLKECGKKGRKNTGGQGKTRS